MYAQMSVVIALIIEKGLIQFSSSYDDSGSLTLILEHVIWKRIRIIKDLIIYYLFLSFRSNREYIHSYSDVTIADEELQN